MIKTTLTIDGMMCSMCEAHVNDAVRDALQVKSVKSSHKKGTTEISGVAGMYRNPKNTNLPTTDWDWTIDPMGLRNLLAEQL